MGGLGQNRLNEFAVSYPVDNDAKRNKSFTACTMKLRTG